MKRLTVSHKVKADADEAYRECEAGAFSGYKVLRVLSKPQPVYGRWEFDIEVAE